MEHQGRDALGLVTVVRTLIRRLLSRLIFDFKITISTLVRKGAILVITTLLVPISVLFVVLNSSVPSVHAAPTTTLNFQARLLTNTGNLVPDGTYNIEFKLYNVSSGGSTLWTDSRYDQNGVTAGLDYRISVVNGYFSVNLADTSVGGTAFPSTIDWSSQLWLTMNIGGTTQTATPTYDGEMTPRIALTAVPLAFTANNVNSGNTSVASTNSANTTLQSGNATGATSNSGSVTIDAGTATSTAGTISLGATNASSLLLGRASFTTTNVGNLTVQGGTTTLGTSSVAGNLVVSDGSSSTITLKSATQVAATNYDLTIPAITANDTLCLLSLANCGVASPFQTTSNVANLVVSTDNVTIGSATNLGKLAVDGDTNEIQLVVQANSTQTSPLIVAQANGGSELFRLHATDATSIFLGNIAGLVDDGTNNQNTAIGQGALSLNAPGERNVAIGSGALQSATVSYYNTAVGYNSSSRIINDGEDNTTIGYESGLNITTGDNNTALGFCAIGSGTGSLTGSGNTAVGTCALQYADGTAVGNTGVGYKALGNVSTGTQYNVGLGYQSGYGIYTGTNNIAVGYRAGYSLDSSTDNIVIGTNAGYLDPTINQFVTPNNLSKATAIGYGAQVQASNSLVLGGQVANQVNVGIGTTSPTNVLSVSPYQYFDNATTASQSTTTITGVSTTFTSAMVGGEVIWANGSKATITAFTDTTHVTATPSQTVSSQKFRIHYAGLQVKNDGTTGLGIASPTAQLHVVVQGSTTNKALIVDNGTSTGDIANFLDNSGATPVLKIADGGAVTLQNTADTTAAFKVNRVTTSTTDVLTVDTTNSQTILRGINSVATLGSEKVSNGTFTGNATGWTLGTGWAYNSNNVLHTAGNTADLEQNVSAVNGETYKVTFTIAGRTAGCVTPRIGGVDGLSLCVNTTNTQLITATGTGNLIFRPGTTFDGTIDTVSVVLVTSSNAVLSVLNSNATAGIEVRAGGIGLENTLIGLNSGRSITIGASNTAIGAYSQYNNVSGFSNVSVGNNSLQKLVSGTDNTAVGNYALTNNNTGDENSAFGYGALSGNITGHYNVAIGGSSLQSNTSASANTALGFGALSSSTIGANNIAIGYAAGNNITIGSNNLILGYNIDAPSSTNSNQLNIANILFGTTIDGTGSTLSTGNLGIGTTAPGARLEVVSQAGGSQKALIINNSTSTGNIVEFQDNGTAVLTIADGGAVTAASNLIIQGGSATLGTTGQAGSLVVSDGSSNTGTILVNATSGDYTFTIPTVTANDIFCLVTLANCGSSSPFQTTSNVANLVVSTDNLTIGSATNLGKLAVDGDTDEIQLLVQGHSTQTSTLVVFEDSAGTDLFNLSGTGIATFQPAASLNAGQTHISQTLTNGAASGTVIGYNQTLTVAPSAAATTQGIKLALTDATTFANTTTGIDLTVTDNGASGAKVNTGLKVTLAGSNTAQKQLGIDVEVNAGMGIRSISSGVGLPSPGCGQGSGTISYGICGASTYSGGGSIGVQGYTKGFNNNLTDLNLFGSAGVNGVNFATASAGLSYIGTLGATATTEAAAYNSVGLYGLANGGAGASVYGGYFTLGSTSTASLGAVLTAQGIQPASVSGANGTDAVDSFTVANGTGGNTTFAAGTAGRGANISLAAGTGGTASGATGAVVGGGAGTLSLSSGAGGAATTSSGSKTAAAGGLLSLTAGNGGAGTTTNGAGGAVNITAGNGGADAAGTKANGGAITLQAGNASTSGTGNGNGGTLTLDSGVLQSVGTSTLNIGTTNASAIVLGNAATTSLTLGQSTATNTISIGNAVPAASATQTINISNAAQSNASSIQAVNILSGGAGSNGTATLSLANNDRVTQVDIGNIAPDAARSLNVFTGNSGFVDTINIGTGAGTVAGAKTIHIGDGTPTGSGTNLITIGSIAALANTTTIQGGNGAGAVSLQAATSGVISIGTTNNNAVNFGTGTATFGGNAIIQGGTATLGTSSSVAGSLSIYDANGQKFTITGGDIAADRALSIPVATASDTFCLQTLANCVSGANTALSNLASVAINTSLLPATDDAIDLGDNTHRFRDAFLGGETLHIGTSTSDEGTIGYTTSSNDFTFQSTGNITLGTSNTTGTLLVLDTKTDSGDPTLVNGATYYNSNFGKFRCAENGAWKDCDISGSGSGVTTVSAFSGSSQSNGATITGTSILFGPADATNPGMVSTGTQTFAGNKTYNGTITVANITPSANLTIGTSDTTGTLLVLDTKTDAGDPSGVNGGMYYSTNTNSFRCYENGAWASCLNDVKTYQVSSTVGPENGPATTLADTVNATNLNTTFKYLGMGTLAKMDGYTTIRIMLRAANTGAQSGTITYIIRNITNTTDLVTGTFTDTTISTREASATVSLTGIKQLAIMVKSSVAADDPTFGDGVIQLER